MTGNVQLIAIVVGVLVVVALAIFVVVQNNRRTTRLKTKFGSEYARTVGAIGGQRSAEANLREREKRVERLEIRPLGPQDKDRYTKSWSQTQLQFVDDPNGAVKAADHILGEVMSTRGYPMGDFEQRAADISVDHPVVVENYRIAHEIAERQTLGKATTEDLRQAMVRYRTLFDELVGDSGLSPAQRA